MRVTLRQRLTSGFHSSRLLASRLLIGLVLFFNVQSALAFLLWPDRYTPGFELEGAVGRAMLQGLGVLFLMWNVPYAVALWHPQRHRLSLYEAIAMQAIGLTGESWIYLSLPLAHSLARASIARFIVFDGMGLLALVVAAWISGGKENRRQDAISP